MDEKEYLVYDLKINNNINKKIIHYTNEEILKDDEKKLKNYQSFIVNWLSYNTTNKSLLVKHDTGLGKTFTSLATAYKFINIYEKLYKNNIKNYNHPYINIVGFTKENFYNELLGNPNFNYITHDELNTLNKYRKLYEKNKTILNKNTYDSFYLSIKKRVTNNINNGFFNFYGYGELFNRLIIFNDSSLELIQKNLLMNKNIIINKTDLNFDILLTAIDKNYVTLNTEFLNTFENSFVICDEIHNVYNSKSLNNYGNALKLIMYYHKNNGIKMLLLSATPINNKPTEIVDLLNILIPQDEIKSFNMKHFKTNTYTLSKNNFFNNMKLIEKNCYLLEELIDGYVSYASSENIQDVPSYKFVGTSISGIKYLKFIKCEITQSYCRMENQNQNYNPLSVSSIYDIIFPKNIITYKDLVNEFVTNTIESTKYTLKQNAKSHILTGDYLKYSNIKKYSPKYHKMLSSIYDNLKNNKGKIFISHQYVNFFGILLIKEILIQNGFIFDNSKVVKTTPCSICGTTLKQHKKITEHNFSETRFLLLYGEIDTKRRNEILLKFNDIENKNGNSYRILLGSKFTNEGIDLKEVQQLFIMSVPIDIPTVIQIMGRGIRTRSHISLPIDKRNVDIMIFVNTYNNNITNEGKQYKEKMDTYLEILKVDKIINKQAIDSFINYNNVESIKSLAYVPSKKYGKVNIDKINTCNSYYYKNTEFQYISYIIKKLFINQSNVYTHDDLIYNIKNPPFSVSYNTSLFNNENINIVINKFLSIGDNYYDISLLGNSYSLFNDNYYINYNNNKYKLVCYDKLYVLSEIVIINNSENILFKTENQKVYGYSNIYKQDYYNIYNITNSIAGMKIDYSEMKYNFYNKYKDVNPLYFPTAFKDFNHEFHKKLIKNVIEYFFILLTNPKAKVSEIHNFYVKCIYFYSSINIIIYANQVTNKNIYSSYSDFITKSKKIYGLQKNVENNCYLEKDNINNPLLVKTLINSSFFSKEFSMDNYNKFIGQFNDSITGVSISSGVVTKNDFIQSNNIKYTKINKVFDTILPIGYYIKDTYLFNPLRTQTWVKQDIFIDLKISQVPEILNNVYGMYKYSDNNLGLIFKIVDNVDKQESDKRKIKTGINCRSLSKTQLNRIAKLLKIKTTHNSESMCKLIELFLIKQQLLEDRRVYKLGTAATKKIKYIFMPYDDIG